MTSPTNDTPNISPAAAVLLAAAVVAGTSLVGVIAAQAVTDVDVYVGTAGLLAAIASVAGVGFIVQLATERVMEQLGQIDERVSAQRVAYLPAPTGTLRNFDEDDLREQVERVVVEELGTREGVRSQGYAEGYVDGIDRDRRGGDGEPSAN